MILRNFICTRISINRKNYSTHAAPGDAMVTVLEGTGRFSVGGEVYFLSEGETLIMPKDIPHAVYGEKQFKMILVVSY